MTDRMPLTAIKSAVTDGSQWDMTNDDTPARPVVVTAVTGTSFSLAPVDPDTGQPDTESAPTMIRWPAAKLVDMDPATRTITLYAANGGGEPRLWLTLTPAGDTDPPAEDPPAEDPAAGNPAAEAAPPGALLEKKGHGQMMLTAERDPLKEAVAWAVRGLPAHPTAPVLACVRISVEAGTATVGAFDYEVSAAADLPLTDGEDGAILVAGRMLNEIVKSLPPYPVTITADGTRATLTCGPAKFTLILFPPEEYPQLPVLTDPVGEVGAEAFATAVAQVVAAAGRDDTLPALTGVRIEFDGGTPRSVATDRYRLSLGLVPGGAWKPAPEAAALEPVLIPAKTLNDAARGMTGADVIQVYVSSETGGAVVGLSGDGKRLTTRTLSGEFPKYQALIPSEFAATATVSADALTEALKRVSLVVERNTPIQMTCSDGKILIEGGTSEDAQASETLTSGVTYTVTPVDDAEMDGDMVDPVRRSAFEAAQAGEFRIAFNPGYLIDALAPLAGGTARFQFTLPTKPAVITPGDETTAPGYQTILVPIRNAG